MNDHMHIHSIDDTCLICGEVNSRVRASWRLSHPTPPTQENELDLDTWFEGRDEQMVNAHIELLKKIVGMSQNKEKPTQEKDCIHLARINNTCTNCGDVYKPTQETESWMEEFRGMFVKNGRIPCSHSHGESAYVHPENILDFIKQKKQWWTDEGYIRGYKQGKGDRAELIKEARTQGAEAAVALIDKELRQYVEAYCLDKEIDDVFERAKKV